MADVAVIDWHIHPFRADRWLEAWRPAAARALAFGATSWTLTRSVDDPLHFRQTSVWEDREDFERYWSSDDASAASEASNSPAASRSLSSIASVAAERAPLARTAAQTRRCGASGSVGLTTRSGRRSARARSG